MLEFYGASPTTLVPDNLRVGVTRADRHEPELQRAYEETAAHFSIGVIPARPFRMLHKTPAAIVATIDELLDTHSEVEITAILNKRAPHLPPNPVHARSRCLATPHLQAQEPPTSVAGARVRDHRTTSTPVRGLAKYDQVLAQRSPAASQTPWRWKPLPIRTAREYRPA